MRAGILPRSPRTIACALIAVSVCFFVPFKLSRDSEVLESVEQPAHLTCSGAPVRKSTSWLPGKSGALTDLHTDEKTVKHYIDKCVLPSRFEEEEVKGSGATVGIAIPAGGTWLLSNTLAVATVLRETLKSTLPIEVVYNGPEEYDELLVSQLQVSYVAAHSSYPVVTPDCLVRAARIVLSCTHDAKSSRQHHRKHDTHQCLPSASCQFLLLSIRLLLKLC